MGLILFCGLEMMVKRSVRVRELRDQVPRKAGERSEEVGEPTLSAHQSSEGLLV
jgi:hypothetical protein